MITEAERLDRIQGMLLVWHSSEIAAWAPDKIGVLDGEGVRHQHPRNTLLL